jgi:hypothetical protein
LLGFIEIREVERIKGDIMDAKRKCRGKKPLPTAMIVELLFFPLFPLFFPNY